MGLIFKQSRQKWRRLCSYMYNGCVISFLSNRLFKHSPNSHLHLCTQYSEVNNTVASFKWHCTSNQLYYSLYHIPYTSNTRTSRFLPQNFHTPWEEMCIFFIILLLCYIEKVKEKSLLSHSYFWHLDLHLVANTGRGSLSSGCPLVYLFICVCVCLWISLVIITPFALSLYVPLPRHHLSGVRLFYFILSVVLVINALLHATCNKLEHNVFLPENKHGILLKMLW